VSISVKEVSMLVLHLLQSALVYVNTLLLQQVLAEPEWAGKLTDADRRALSPLFWTHVNHYGRFEFDMNSRLDLARLAGAVPGPEQAADGTEGPVLTRDYETLPASSEAMINLASIDNLAKRITDEVTPTWRGTY
jgi:hypothetical protein